jgi:hypothetical protein
MLICQFDRKLVASLAFGFLFSICLLSEPLHAQPSPTSTNCGSGHQVVPPNTSLATGIAQITANSFNGTMSYSISYSGLSGPPIGVGLYSGDCNQAGPLVLNIVAPFNSPILGVTTPLNSSDFNKLITGRLYLVIRTAQYPAGEIRFQLFGTTCGICIDCNGNGLPDLCDISCSAPCNTVVGCGTSLDTNSNLRPDDCEEIPSCNPNVPCCLDVVYIMETELSDGLGAPGAMCTSIAATAATLNYQGVSYRATVLGIDEDRDDNSNYSCLTDNVKSLYGSSVPGGGKLSKCFLNADGKHEDWGRAVSIVASRHAWLPNCKRLIVPITDSAPHCGSPCKIKGKDKKTVDNAIQQSLANNVTVMPVVLSGSGTDQCEYELTSHIASKTELLWDAHPFHPNDVNLPFGFVAHVAAKCCVTPPQQPFIEGWWPFDHELTSDALPFMSDLTRGRPGFYQEPAFNNGSIITSGKVSTGLLLDGKDDNVVINPISPDPLDFPTGSFTLDAWVTVAASKPEQTLISKQSQSSPFRGYRFYLKNNRPALTLISSNQTLDFVSSQTIVADQSWHLLMVSVERGSVRTVTFFIDGEYAGIFTIPPLFGSISNNGPILIGGPVLTSPNPSGPSWKGKIDEVEIFSKALTQSESCRIARAGTGGKCKKNQNCLGHCSGNLIPNGSFECGQGAACPQNLSGNDGLGGLFDWTHSASGCQDLPAWVGDESHQGDCSYDSQGRNSKNWATSGAHGSRFGWLDVDYNLLCQPIRQECLATQLHQQLLAGHQYKLSWAAIAKKRKTLCLEQAVLEVSIAGDPIDFGQGWGGEGTNGQRIAPGKKDLWGPHGVVFTPTSMMTNPASSIPRQFVMKARRGRGLVIDAACLRLVGSPKLAYQFQTFLGSNFTPDAINGLNGLILGNPTLVPGQVSNAFLFDGQDDAITTNDNSVLNFGTGSFSIGMWIYPQTSSLTTMPAYSPLVRKLNSSGVGYVMYLEGGRLALRIQGSTAFKEIVAPLSSVQVKPRRWSYVAVSVDRPSSGSGSISLYVNGVIVGSLDIAGFTQDLTNNGHLIVARWPTTPSTPQLSFRGIMDELYLHSSSLSEDEIFGLASSGRNPTATQEFVVMPTGSAYCQNGAQSQHTTVRPLICNYTSSEQRYNFIPTAVLAADDPLDECDIDGPTGFSPSRGQVRVLPGQCFELPITINRPAGLTTSNRACFSLEVENTLTQDTITSSEEYTLLGGSNLWCKTSVSAARSAPLNATINIPLTVENQGTSSTTLNYEVRSTSFDLQAGTKISLNNQSLGSPIIGSTLVASGQATNISFQAKPRQFLRNIPELLTLWIDINGDSILDPVDTIPLTTTVGDCNANAQQDDTEIVTGNSPDCNNNLVPDICDIGTVSTDLNFNTNPDECDL